MNILVFEYKNFGIEDLKESFDRLEIKYNVITTELMRERVSHEFDEIFSNAFDEGSYDCVFSFNFCPVISVNCNKRNIPYISLVYDSPQVMLYSYTIINPCNYCFIFDKAMYMDLKKEGINTVYYAPLCANTARLDKMSVPGDGRYVSDISFVGSMYNEKHNLYDRLTASGISNFTKGFLDAVIDAQMMVYGDFFMDQMLNGEVLNDMMKCMPVEPNKDGVETVNYLYSHYFMARKLASKERARIFELLSKQLSSEYNINLFTPNPTPELTGIKNCGSVDYYNQMPLVFKSSSINLNISLRSIRTGIPLRGIDIMGAGGFLLSNYQEDYYDFFVPGEDCVLYESHEDLVNKCRYYLTHDRERSQIAANGHGKVQEHHTYDIRIRQILETVFS
ncbi:MAG: DUF3880 domain-containing protein [Lachnospira sp.]